MEIRAAMSRDASTIAALVDAEVRRGTVLPRSVRAEDFLVACEDDRVVGAVALSPLTPAAAELGTLVATVRGRGVGRALVEAALDRAERLGFGTVVALTGAPGFFERCGFDRVGDTPWLRARRRGGLGDVVPLPAPADVAGASAAKSRACARCPLLASCRQVFLTRRTAVALRSHA